MDILADAFDRIMAAGARLAVLGSGDHALEAALSAASARNAGRAGSFIGYDEGLSHLLQGGADAILVPSRFEPCGLTQLYGLRYGCIPLVARTGGLADTVVDANDAALSSGAATGVLFDPGSAEAMIEAVHRMVALHGDRELWTSMQKQAMRTDVSWRHSASRYVGAVSVRSSRENEDGACHHGSNHPLSGPEARHVGPAQEGTGLPAAELRRELHPVGIRFGARLRAARRWSSAATGATSIARSSSARSALPPPTASAGCWWGRAAYCRRRPPPT